MKRSRPTTQAAARRLAPVLALSCLVALAACSSKDRVPPPGSGGHGGSGGGSSTSSSGSATASSGSTGGASTSASSGTGTGGASASSSGASSTGGSSSSSSAASSSSSGTLPATVLDFDVFHYYAYGGNYAGEPFALGDFNGDGRVDAAFPLQSVNQLAVVLAGPGGVYQAPVNYAANGAYAVATGDVDGDGKLDLVVTTIAFGAKPSLFLGNGDGTFQAPKALPGSPLYSPLLVDLDGDGKLDLLGGVQGTTQITMLKGDGTGGFTVGTPIDVGTGIEPRRFLLADVDGDGKHDLVTLNAAQLSKPVVSVRLGLGAGAFGPVSKITIMPQNGISVGNGGDLAAADFDGDGKADVAVLDVEGVTLLKGAAGGALTAVTRLAPTFAHSCAGVTAADLDHDGKMDLIVSSNSDSRLTVLRGDGAGGFGPPRLYSTGDRGYGIAAADADGDGQLDLLISAGALGVALGRGDGTFRAAPILSFADDVPAGSAMGDLDHDGLADVVVAGSSTSTLAVFRGQAGGTFAAPATAAAGAKPGLVVLAQMNADAHLDLVFGSGSSVGVLLGDGLGGFGAPKLYAGGPKIALGDFNGDGSPDVAATTFSAVAVLLNDKSGGLVPSGTIPAGMNLWDVAAGDLDGDGKIDLVAGGWDSSDVTVLLGDGNGGFHAAGVTPLGGSVVRVAIADYTGDGKPDVLAAVGGTVNAVLLLPNQGNATFGAPTSIMVPYPSTFVTPDFTSDNNRDLFYTVSNGGLRGVLGKGNGTFGPPVSFTSLWTTSLTAGELSGDGRPDVLVTSAVTQQHGYVSVFVNASH